MTTTPDSDAELRRTLVRHQSMATGLLVGMGGLLLGSYALPGGYWTQLLQAAAKAGVVGGLADWFAVTALFRRPLGLPIPHTAIIPAQKARLADGLGRFVATQVFAEAEVRRVLQRLDLSGVLRGFLADPVATRPAAQAMAAMLPRVLEAVADGRARRTLTRLLPRLAGGPGGARILARALRALIEGGRHQEVLDLAISGARALLVEKQVDLGRAIEARVRAEGGALVGWLAGAAVARRVLGAVTAELERMEPTDSDLRGAVEAWLITEIERLEHEPERAAAMGRALRRVLEHPAVRAWLGDVWTRLAEGIAADAAKPDGRAAVLLEAGLANAGALLSEDAAARAQLNAAAEVVLLTLLPAARTELAGFIANVIRGWDGREVTDKIELRVGRDLQYVRMNGTLVGFLVGAALFALLHAVFGSVAF